MFCKNGTLVNLSSQGGENNTVFRNKPSSGRKRLGPNGRPVQHPEIETFAINLFDKFRSEGKAIPMTVLREKTKTFAKTIGIDIECSVGWGSKFMKRNNLSTRTKTSGKQQPPANYEEAILNFQTDYVRTIIAANIEDPERIINVDETPICFDMPYKTTLEKKER